MPIIINIVHPWVPLHFAARNGHLPITKYLIEEHGCDPMCRTKKGEGTLHIVAEKGHFDTMKYLIEKQGCDPRCKTMLGTTAPYFAAENKHVKMVNYLLEKGADPIILASSFSQFTNFILLSC